MHGEREYTDKATYDFHKSKVKNPTGGQGGDVLDSEAKITKVRQGHKSNKGK